MKPSVPVLSICIPTFNRPGELREALTILNEELLALDPLVMDKVEVLVSDNASTSVDVSELVSEILDSRIRARTQVQSRNVGPTLNFESCFRNSSGEYVLLLSDDDHLVRGSASQILSLILDARPDLVFLPFFETGCPEEGAVQMERNDFLRRVGVYPTLISSFVCRRVLIEGALGKYLHTHLHHLYYFLAALEVGERFFYCRRRILQCPYENNSGGYNWFKVFLGDFFEITSQFPATRVSRDALMKIQSEMFLDRVIPSYFNWKIEGFSAGSGFHANDQWELMELAFRHARPRWAFWCLFVPLWLTPVPVLRILRKFYHWQKSRFLDWHKFVRR